MQFKKNNNNNKKQQHQQQHKNNNKKTFNPFTAVDAIIWCSEFRQRFSVLKQLIIQYIPISCYYVALTYTSCN